MGVLHGGGDCRGWKSSFGGKCEASHCNHWGLCCVVVQKSIEPIEMRFAVVSGVGEGIGVVDGGPCAQSEGEVLGVFRSHWFEWYILTEIYSTLMWKVDNISVRTIYHWNHLFVGFPKMWSVS